MFQFFIISTLHKQTLEDVKFFSCDLKWKTFSKFQLCVELFSVKHLTISAVQLGIKYFDRQSLQYNSRLVGMLFLHHNSNICCFWGSVHVFLSYIWRTRLVGEGFSAALHYYAVLSQKLQRRVIWILHSAILIYRAALLCLILKVCPFL